MLLKLLACSFIFLLLTGCYGGETNTTAINNDELIVEELIAFAHGILDYPELGEDFVQFEYTGEEIRIWYDVEGWTSGTSSRFGLIFLVDGIPHQTRLEMGMGEVFRENQYMHDFALAYRERLEFYVIFTPTVGELGETIAITSIAIVTPNAIPDDIEHPSFYSSHTHLPMVLAQLKISSRVENRQQGFTTTDFQPISEEIHQFHRRWLTENEAVEDILAEFPRLLLFPTGEESYFDFGGIITANDNKVLASLIVYGGQEVTSRVTFFVNHQPVAVNGYDFIEIQMRDGQMLLIELELTVEDLSQFNSLYAMMMPIGEDYLVQGMYGTHPVLLVNE